MSAVRFHAPFCDRQPKTGAATFAGTPFVHAIKTIEHLGSGLGRNTGTTVLHVDGDTSSGRNQHLDRNSAAPGRVLDRVIQQIDKYLPEYDPVGFHAGRTIPAGLET